jgi:hypothetical protein
MLEFYNAKITSAFYNKTQHVLYYACHLFVAMSAVQQVTTLYVPKPFILHLTDAYSFS